MPTQVFLVIFFVLLALGMPIYLVLGTTAGSLFLISGQPLMGVAQKILDELNSTLLLAVPFFVMAAVFMQKGGIEVDAKKVTPNADPLGRSLSPEGSRAAESDAVQNE